MSLRPTLALLVLAAALGLYVYFAEVGGEAEREEAERAEKQLLHLDREAVTAVELPLDAGGSARLVRDADSGEWRLEEPLSFPADADSVDAILSTLEELESKSLFESAPGGLAPFGLGEGRVSVRIWSGADAPVVLHLGADTPIDNGVYVALEGEGERFHTIEKFRATALRPDLKRLRDKRMSKLEVTDVTAFRVVESGRVVASAERVAPAETPEPEGEVAAAEWRLTEPVQDRGDPERIRRFLQDLSFARATEFIDAPGSLEPYGLDEPELQITLEADGRTESIALGKGSGKAFCRVNDQPVVYETRERLLTNTPRSTFPFRYKQVLSLDTDRVREVELVFPRDDAAYRFRKEDESWSPVEAEIEVQSMRTEDLLFALEDLKATGIEEPQRDRAALGLDPPGVRVVLRDEGGAALGRLELGDPSPGQGIPAVASSADASPGDRIWRVINDLAESVPIGLEAFEHRWLEPAKGGAESADAEVGEESGESLE